MGPQQLRGTELSWTEGGGGGWQTPLIPALQEGGLGGDRQEEGQDWGWEGAAFWEIKQCHLKQVWGPAQDNCCGLATSPSAGPHL